MVEYKQIIKGLNIRPEIGFFGYSSVTLIKDGNENILVDTGGYGVRKYLANFIQENPIDKIFISHLHFDHCANINIFKNIPIYIHEREINDLHKKDQDIYSDIYEFIKKSVENLNVIAFNKEDHLSENTRIRFSHGHTLGHSSLEIINQNKKIIIAGDAVETYQEYCDPNYKAEPFDKVAYKKSLDFIKQNYDIIIPGHDSPIENGSKTEAAISFKLF